MRILNASELDVAAQLLREGQLVAIPTETVYGLGANALDPEAVRNIYLAKGRPSDNPLIIHVPGREEALRYTRDVPETALMLMLQEEDETALAAKLKDFQISITRMDAAEIATEIEHAEEQKLLKEAAKE